MISTDQPPEIFADYQAYAVVSHDDELLKRFKVILRCGTTISIPYSLLPVIILPSGEQLIIKAYELLITIEGVNLRKLEDALSRETVTFIKESPTGHNDGQSTVFISNIKIEGEAITH